MKKSGNTLIDPNHYRNVYVTSDLHLGHENILSYEYSRYEMMGTNEQTALYRTLKEMNLSPEEEDKLIDEEWESISKQCRHNYIKKHDEKLIENWNSVVKNGDLVYILGDFSYKNGIGTNEYLQKMNGDKVLIRGNHDHIFLDDKKFDRTLLKEIYDYKELKYKKNMIILFHYPIMVWNKQHKGTIHLYGHIHSNKTTSHPAKYSVENSYNVGVDVNNYKPVRLDDFLENNRIRDARENGDMLLRNEYLQLY